MNWPGVVDRGTPQRERDTGINYDASRPAKAAAYDPSLSLTALAKAHMARGGANPYEGAPLARSLDWRTRSRSRYFGVDYWSILQLRDLKMRMGKATYQRHQADADYRGTVAMIKDAPIEEVDRETLLASIA